MTPVISDLRITAFRGLKSIELNSLGKFNLLVGFNNSGKSSILEAIEYFCKPADPLTLINLSRRREISVRAVEPMHTLRWLFPKDTAEPDDDFFESEISVSGKVFGVRRTIETTLRSHLSEVYVSPVIRTDESDPGHETISTTTTSPETIYQKRIVDLVFLYFEGETSESLGRTQSSSYTLVEGQPFNMYKAVQLPSIPCSVISSVSHRVDSSQTKAISNAILSKQKEDIIRVVQLFEPDIKDIVILDVGGYPEAWMDHATRGFMPLSGFGDGLRRVLVIASSLTFASNGVLLIDEIETAVHKDALRDVFRWLRDSAEALNVQVFATTHSLEAIDAILLAEKDQTDEVIVYRLPTPKMNERLVRYSGETLCELRVVGGMEVR